MNKRGETTRKLIKEKSYQLFAKKGFKEVTMKDICMAAGLSRGGLYCHYNGTGQIFKEIIDDLMNMQDEEFASKMELQQSAIQILDDVLSRYETEMKDSSASLSVAIFEYFSLDDNFSDENAIAAQYQLSVQMWHRFIQYGIDRGEFRPVDIQAVIDLIIFSYQGVRLYSELMPIGPELPARITRQIRQILVKTKTEVPIRSTIFTHFNNENKAFLEPMDTTESIPDFPKLCVTTFSENIIQKFAEMPGVKTIAALYSANGILPVYEINYMGNRIAFFLSRVGAPACVSGLEEIIAMGAKKLVMFGSAGILNETAAQGKIILPTAAVRDEGTSYHYYPASDEIHMDEHSINTMEACLLKHHIPYVLGKTWTTDAIYRETPKIIEARKQQGCISVEMECSASLAVTKFRQIPFAQFLYGADSLAGENWEPNDLTEYGLSEADKYMMLAFECVICL